MCLFFLLLFLSLVDGQVLTGELYVYDWTTHSTSGDSLGFNNHGSTVCTSSTGCAAYTCAIALGTAGCSNAGQCFLASELFSVSSSNGNNGPGGLIATSTSLWGKCVCQSGWSGAMCEYPQQTLSVLTQWRYALPMLLTYRTVGAVIDLTPNTLFQSTGLYASIEYGYHTGLRTTNYFDWLVNQYTVIPGVWGILPIGQDGQTFLNEWMPRYPFNYIQPPAPDPNHGITLYQKPDTQISVSSTTPVYPTLQTTKFVDCIPSYYKPVGLPIEGQQTCYFCEPPNSPDVPYYSCDTRTTDVINVPSNSNCPYGMRTFGTPLTGLFCGPDPEFVDAYGFTGRAGCSGRGVAVYRNDPNMNALLDRWCFYNPKHCQQAGVATGTCNARVVIDDGSDWFTKLVGFTEQLLCSVSRVCSLACFAWQNTKGLLSQTSNITLPICDQPNPTVTIRYTTDCVIHTEYLALQLPDADIDQQPAVCLCDGDYVGGFFCELDIAPSVFCSGNGVWTQVPTVDPSNGVIDPNQGHCSCATGWYGDACENADGGVLICNQNGVYVPGHGCVCTNPDYWGTYCNETCRYSHCNGSGECHRITDAGYDDGLSNSPAFQGISQRVSDICQCDIPENPNLLWNGTHCTILTIKTAQCDGHGTMAYDDPPSGLYNLGGARCIRNDPSNDYTFRFIPETGRTIQECKTLAAIPKYDTDMYGSSYQENSVHQQCGYPDRGVCVIPDQYNTSTIAYCQCKDRYQGQACELTRCPVKYGAVCSGQGRCVPEINRCVCNQGFVGDACEYYDDGTCGHNTQFINNNIDSFH